MEIGLVILIVALIIAGAIFGAVASRKRREAFAALAARLNLNFSSENDRQLPEQFGFLDKLAQGSNRYAFNILSGQYRNYPIIVFDYHYETHSTDSKGHRQTHHHYFSFLILTMEKSFPELSIAREGIFSKISQAFGYDDIDFESHEFSRKFCVRSKDKKFAYDVCHVRMMEYLLAQPELNIEIEGTALALAFSTTLKAEEIEPNLRRLTEVRGLLPEYLFAT